MHNKSREEDFNIAHVSVMSGEEGEPLILNVGHLIGRSANNDLLLAV